MKWKKVSPELSEFLENALEGFECEKRKMFGCPAYFLNNNMFTGVHQDNIFLRLSDVDKKEICIAYDETTPFEPMKGRVMKEYMVVPEVLYSDPDELDAWLKRSYQYISNLPTKESKRKKKK